MPKTTRENKILGIIEELGGRATFTQINEKLTIDKGNLSGLLKNAVSSGKLQRNPCPHCKGNDIFVLNS